MAKSGRIERIIGTSGAYTEWLEWVVNSQDIESNKSNITVRFLAARTTGSASNGAYSNYTTNKIWLRVGGSVVYENTKAKIDLRTSSGRELATWTGDVEHDSDGKLSLALEGEFYFSSTAATSLSQGNYLVSGTATIDTIPRASSISVTDADIGTDAIITINKASDSFTSTLTYEFKGLTGTIATKTKETVVLFRIPQSFADKMPEKSSKCTLKCVTYSAEGNYIGEKIVDFNVVSRDTVTVSGSVTDGNDKTYALTGNRSKLVRYKSTAVVSINATTDNSATISQKTINGQDASSGSVSFENVVSGQFVLYAKNSRGYEKQETISADVVAYVPLTCICEVVRSDGVSSTATLSVQGDYYNGSFGSQSNSLKLSYKIKESGGSYGSPVTITPTISGGKYTASVQLSNVAYDKQYTVEVTAEDKLTTIADDDIIMKSEPIYWWDDVSFNANVPIEVKGSTTKGLATINQTNADYPYPYIRCQYNGTNKASLGYYENMAFVANDTTNARIGVNDSGVPQYWSDHQSENAKTLLHSGNVSSYAAPAGYGFGSNTMPTAQNTMEANAISVNCFTSFRPGIIDATKGFWGQTILENGGSYGSQLAYSIGGLEARREKSGGTWQPWEWVNPPMVVGTEYRTTKRFNNKVVYTKLVEIGETPASGSSKSVNVAPAGSTIVSVSATGRSNDNLVCRPFPIYNNNGAIQSTIRVTNQVDLTVTVHAWSFTSAYKVVACVEYVKD